MTFLAVTDPICFLKIPGLVSNVSTKVIAISDALTSPAMASDLEEGFSHMFFL